MLREKMPSEKRLIDANALLDEFLKRYTESERNGNLVFAACEIKQDFADMISNVPNVDAVEVVRCKECKYYCQDKINGVICRHPELDFDTECYDHWINTNPDDFCSYGERKEGAD